MLVCPVAWYRVLGWAFCSSHPVMKWLSVEMAICGDGCCCMVRHTCSPRVLRMPLTWLLLLLQVRDIERSEIEFIAKTLGCLPIAHVDHMKPEKLGTADMVEEVECGKSRIVKVTGITTKGRTTTVGSPTGCKTSTCPSTFIRTRTPAHLPQGSCWRRETHSHSPSSSKILCTQKASTQFRA